MSTVQLIVLAISTVVAALLGIVSGWLRKPQKLRVSHVVFILAFLLIINISLAMVSSFISPQDSVPPNGSSKIDSDNSDTNSVPPVTVTERRGGNSAVFVRDGAYDYAPAAMKDDLYKMWWCGGAPDQILYAVARFPSGPWHSLTSYTANTNDVALTPTGGNDGENCDPDVIRVGSTYYMYYDVNNTAHTNLSSIAAATSTDGIHWTKVNSGAPIISAHNTANRPNRYGAGHPSAVYKDGYFYLFYNDTTGVAVDGKGGGTFVIRSPDPTFTTGTTTLTATDWQPWSTSTGTTFSIIDRGFEPDFEYNDTLGEWIVATASTSTSSLSFVSADLTKVLSAPTGASIIAVPFTSLHGMRVIHRADGHSVPAGTCGTVPIDLVGDTGTTTSSTTWDLSWAGLTLNTGLTCSQVESRLPKIYEGEEIQLPHGGTLALVVAGERIEFALAAPADDLANDRIGVTEEVYHDIPRDGGLHTSATVYEATDRFPAFLLDNKKLLPVTCSNLITDNRSNITFISDAQWDSYDKIPKLKCVLD